MGGLELELFRDVGGSTVSLIIYWSNSLLVFSPQTDDEDDSEV